MPHLRAQPATNVSIRHLGKQRKSALMLTEEADEALMLRYQQGEVRAFEILLTRHRRPVFNFILRFVQNRELAEDLLQEAFLRVIRSAANYKRQAKFTTWLYRIARNYSIDYYVTDDWSGKMYDALAYAGFISVSTKDEKGNEFLLPEMQFSYAVLNLYYG